MSRKAKLRPGPEYTSLKKTAKNATAQKVLLFGEAKSQKNVTQHSVRTVTKMWYSTRYFVTIKSLRNVLLDAYGKASVLIAVLVGAAGPGVHVRAHVSHADTREIKVHVPSRKWMKWNGSRAGQFVLNGRSIYCSVLILGLCSFFHCTYILDKLTLFS